MHQLASRFAIFGRIGLASCVIGVALIAAPAPTVFPVTHVNHISMVVTDYAKSRDFYVRVLGMRVAWDDGKACALEFGEAAAPNGIYLRSLNPGEHPGANHIAFAMTDFMARKATMKTELDRRGLTNIRPDGAVGWSFNDPARYPLNVAVVKDKAMFPGAASVCGDAASAACADAYAAGVKNLGSMPVSGRSGLTASAFSHIVLRVDDVGGELAFYRDMLGMRVIQELDAAQSRAALRFGRNTLFLRKLPKQGDKPVVDHFAFLVDDWNRAGVKAALVRQALTPTMNSNMAWTIADPDGFPIEVAAWGLPEYVAANCSGKADRTPHPECPGGADQ
jgi:catechol 2,3-dioxygenase-like lactoylglutathione lyase family enzyme